MAFTVEEAFSGLTLEDDFAQIEFIITDTTASHASPIDEIAAKTALDNHVVDEFNNKPLEKTGITQLINYKTARGYARWSYKSPVDPDYIQYSFDISTGTQHVTQAIANIAKYPAVTAPPTKGVIGINTKGDAQGVDILVADGSWSETQYFGDEEITSNFKHLLRTMVGSVNHAPFKGDLAGECLFLGVAGTRITKAIQNPSPRQDRWNIFLWEMQFRFATSENHTAALGNPIPVKLKSGDVLIDKLGWDYLWYLYEKTKVAAAEDQPGMIIEQPVACYVDQVYPRKDFAALTIGT